jgi:hypothetical protein
MPRSYFKMRNKKKKKKRKRKEKGKPTLAKLCRIIYCLGVPPTNFLLREMIN